MDRAERSRAIIAEMQALEGARPDLLALDLATLEQRVQQGGRVLLRGLMERVAQAQAQGLPRRARGAACGGRLKRQTRPRRLVGLGGDYAVRRAYYWGLACGRSAVPRDAAIGLGAGMLSPGLARVGARAAVETCFETARMDYPRFVAQQCPSGAGAVESSCTCVVAARRTGAGMRWAAAGSPAIARLRALHRSGRWPAFWHAPPQRHEARPTPHAAGPDAPCVRAAASVLAGPPVVAAPANASHSAPRPHPTARQRPLILPRSA